MKKISLYLMTLLTVVVFASCDDDYDDWAAPQSNGQEDSVELSFQPSVLASTIDLNAITTDSIDILDVSNITLEEGGSAAYEVYLGAEANFTDEVAIPFAVDENRVRVAVYDLEDIAWEFFGKEGKSNELQLRVYGIAITAQGQATRVESNDIPLTLVTPTLPIEENYYMVGDVNNWSQADPVKFTDMGDGFFELIIDIEDADSNFKIIPQSGIDNLDIFWSSALGTAENGDNSKTGTLVYQREGGPEPGAIVVNGIGERRIRLNMNDYTYKTGPLFEMPENMFVTGSPWNWELLKPGGYAQMIPINGQQGFWLIQYLEADSQIKFFPQNTSWDNGLGFPEVTIPAESIALAELSNVGNIQNGKAGWYILMMTANEFGEYTVQYLEPEVWLIGPTSNGGWADIATNSKDLFTVPVDGTGEFISPEFLASDNLRMAVALPGFDWWRSEFNIFSGKIDYRGNGGDQAPVVVTAGQKAYLNFGDSTGRIE